MRALIVALTVAGIICGAALLAIGCTDDNPQFMPQPFIVDASDSGATDLCGESADASVPADMASGCVPLQTGNGPCGCEGLPCCLGACNSGMRCGNNICIAPSRPDMAPPPPDMTWRLDLSGGKCVPYCGECIANTDCCPDEHASNCIQGRCQPGNGSCPTR